MNRRLLSALLCALLLLCLLPGAALAADDWSYPTQTPTAPIFAGGAGSEGDPWQIATAQQLANMAYLVNNENATYGDDHYILTADIVLNEGDLSNYNGTSANTWQPWTPIGPELSRAFKGHFDGQNHTVSGLYFNDPTATDDSNKYIGLFGVVSGGTVQNASVANSYIHARVFVGGVVGILETDSVMDNCSNSGTIKAIGDACGGVAGYNLGSTMTNCANSGTVTGNGTAGIAGYSTFDELLTLEATVINCVNSGAVSGSSACGIVGHSWGSTVINCANSGTITATGTAGGIVASANALDAKMEILNCYNSGAVSASGESSTAGAVLGSSTGSGNTITNCYWLTGSATAAVGQNNGNVTVTNSASFTAAQGKGVTDTLRYTVATTQTGTLADALNAWVAAQATPNIYKEWMTVGNRNNGYPVYKSGIIVSFDATGGSVDPPAYLIDADSHIPALPTPTRSSYRFDGWFTQAEDGDEVAADREYTANTTVFAHWTYVAPPDDREYFDVIIEQSPGGKITNDGREGVRQGDDMTFKITPDEGYIVFDLLVDGKSVGPQTEYTIENAQGDHTLSAIFAKGDMANFKQETPYNGYKDVTESKWYGTQKEGVIRTATELGVMAGTGGGKFSPEQNITIGEIVKMAAVVYNTYYGSPQTFDQKESAHWYDTYVTFAIKHSIIKSDDFTNYGAIATRAQMAYVFAHSLPEAELQPISKLTPPDVKTSDKYAQEIYQLYAAGIIQGVDKAATFAPQRAITRAESAALITRIALPDQRRG